MPTVTLRDATCRYEVVGNDGPPVLLVMGYGMTGAAWAPVVERLAVDHRVCWYDVRGLGGSAPGRLDRHTLPDLADDAAALLDHLGWERAHVAGISMGGMIAQHLALQHRARLRSLTLIATHACGRSSLPSPVAIRRFAEANLARGEARLKALRGLLFPPGSAFDREATFGAAALQQLATPASSAVRLRHLAGILKHDTRAQLARLAGLPTLVLRPDQDVLVPPRCSDVLVAAIPGARLVSFADGGHGLIAQHPDGVTEAMRALFAEA